MPNWPRVAVVCATYRDPSKSSLARFYGVMALAKQMLEQKYDGDIRIAIVDSSPTPHPFFEKFPVNSDSRVLYLHVPDRNNLSDFLRVNFPEAAAYIPQDCDILNRASFWGRKLEEISAWGNFIPFEPDYPIRHDFKATLLGKRPPIGMKKNIGLTALREVFGDFDVVACADDDDLRSENYVSEIVSGLGKNDFGRMVHWLTLSQERGKTFPQWGEFKADFLQGANGHWYLSPEIRKNRLTSHIKFSDGTTYDSTLGAKYSPLLCGFFPPLGHDGALHVYKFSTWQKAMDDFGGFAPASFGEDMITYRQCLDAWGVRGFRVQAIRTVEPQFIRVTDGNNASIVEITSSLNEGKIPSWAKSSAQLSAWLATNCDPMEAHVERARKIASHYLEAGEFPCFEDWQIPCCLTREDPPRRPLPDKRPL